MDVSPAFGCVALALGSTITFKTPFVILTIGSVAHNDWHLALARVLNTVIGAAIALSVTYLLRPKSGEVVAE